MLYGCPCTVVSRNPVFLYGLGQEPQNADELVAMDAAVSALQAQLHTAKMTADSLGNQSVTFNVSCYKPPRSSQARCRKQTMSVKDFAGSKYYRDFKSWYRKNKDNILARGAMTWNGIYGGRKEAAAMADSWKRAKKNISSIQGRLSAAEKTAMARLTQALPYKSYVIQPVKEGSKIVYQLTKDGQKIGSPFARAEEAKAKVDQEIAEQQAAKVKEWEQQRLEAEKRLKEQQPSLPSLEERTAVLRRTMQPPPQKSPEMPLTRPSQPAPQPAPAGRRPPAPKKGGAAPWLVGGAAAAAGLYLLVQ